MNDQGWQDPKAQAEAALEVMRLGAKAQAMVTEFLARHAAQAGIANVDPLNISSAFMELTAKMLSDPAKLAQTQLALWQDYMKLWHATSLKMLGKETPPVIEPTRGDKRFKSEDWRENAAFDFIKQAYLLSAKYVHQAVENTQGLSDKERAKIDFFTRQFVNALSPTNFALTNPEVLRATIEEKGQNLIRGLENVLEDLERGKGQLAVKMTDMEAFEIGRNVATSPGKVVFQNRLFQLIQYAPSTKQVHRIPILFLPPWINKFYILDLTPEKSLIKWLVDEGYTVFCVSWVNPDGAYAETGFEDYMVEGALKAIEVARQAAKVAGIHVVGYCIAGTLLAAALAYLSARGEAGQVKTATFFTAQVDFTKAGELQVFVDEKQLEAIDKRMAEKGYLDSAAMATTFNLLRANDLIWSFVVNNYLLGKEPLPFDLLYWNADSTRMPRAMHLYYLKNFYHENNLIKPGKLKLAGVPIDLGKIKSDIYIQAGKEDHIAPFPSVYRMLTHFKGDTRFILAGSGHIAGVINPPAARKYQYWTNEARPATAQEWLAGAAEHPGSWWPDWNQWLAARSEGKVPARIPGRGKFKAIEDAPGAYVKVRG
ncbi:MAG: PHA/PHB synthase family protein [Pseudomonadota bacterium]